MSHEDHSETLGTARVRDRTEKYCPGCGKTLTLDWFANDKGRPDGKEGYCKPCKREKRRQRRNDDGET